MPSIKLVKKSHAMKAGPAKKAKAGDPVPNYVLTDADCGCTDDCLDPLPTEEVST